MYVPASGPSVRPGMSMGMENGTANFQRMMDHCRAWATVHDGPLPRGSRPGPLYMMDHCRGAAGLGHCAFAYVDDVLIHSASPEQRIKDVCAVL